MYVCSINKKDYYADFKKMIVREVDCNSRISKSYKVRFEEGLFYGNISETILIYLLPKYSKFLDIDSKIDKKLLYGLSADLNDLACKNFNSFGGGKGE